MIKSKKQNICLKPQTLIIPDTFKKFSQMFPDILKKSVLKKKEWQS